MDRITRAERAPSAPRTQRVVAEPVVDGHETRLPASAFRPQDLLRNTDTGLSRDPAMVGSARHFGG
jgi:hypothetical protein